MKLTKQQEQSIKKLCLEYAGEGQSSIFKNLANELVPLVEKITIEAQLLQAKNDLEAMQDGDSDYEFVLDNQRDEVARLEKATQ